jgi:enoyl-[acyl-carrier protein] reductase/trans-2-enoyl-CoA reductase (NAD+)
VDGCVKGRKSIAPGATTVAYSYIGSLTEAVYRKGTIGRAKDDLEATAFTITDSLDINGKLMFL